MKLFALRSWFRVFAATLVLCATIGTVLLVRPLTVKAAACAISTNTTIDQTYINTNSCATISITGTPTIIWSGTTDLIGDGTVTVASGTATFSGAVVLGSTDSMIISSGATVTHAASDSVGVNITATTLTVAGSINANAKGCAGGAATASGLGPDLGTGVCTSATSGFGAVNAFEGGGGSYGGRGRANFGGVRGSIYGVNTAPLLLGSGGGGTTDGGGVAGGAGGGKIRLDVSGVLTLSGSLSVSGANGVNGGGGTGGGGGSGGAIYVTTGTLAGAGTMAAAGGGSYYAEGGAGRIAVYYNVNSSFTLTNISALKGGVNAENGSTFILDRYTDDGAGNLTITSGLDFQSGGDYLRTSITVASGSYLACGTFATLDVGATATLAFTNSTWLCSTVDAINISAATLTMTGAANVISFNKTGALVDWNISNDVTLNNLTYTGGAAGSTSANGGVLSMDNAINVVMVNTDINSNLNFTGLLSVNIDSQSSFSANALGCAGGAASANGFGPSLTTGICTLATSGYGAVDPYVGGGGSHGGRGQASYSGVRSSAYDSNTLPVLFGSGGGGTTTSGGRAGGAGGGKIRLDVSGTFTDAGFLSATGANGIVDNSSGTGSGAGSGGSIYVTAGTLAGAGTISATGGTYSNYGAYGAGGRVAVYYNANASFTLGNITAATGGSPAEAGTVYTLQVTSVSLTASTQTVAESVGSVTVTAQLSGTYGSDITIPYTVSGTATAGGVDHNLAAGNITVTASSLTGGVTFSVVNDSIDENDETVIVTLGTPSYGSLVSPSVQTITITDNDTAGFTVGTISRHTTEAGVMATATIVLTSQPTADVSVGLTSSNTAEGTISPASFTFTSANWSTPQTVTATGVNDFVQDGNIVYSIVTAAATSSDGLYSGVNPADISVTNDDNDTAGFTVGTISGNTTEAGGTATATIVLTSQPTASVIVGLTSSNTAEGIISPASFTFTTGNWNSPQTVTVTGVDDFVDDGDILYSVVTAAATSSDILYNAVNPANIAVTNTDNDTAGFTVGTISRHTTEAGVMATATIVLTSQPTADVSVGLTSSNTAEGTISPASFTFTSANWSTPQTVTATGVNDDVDDGDIIYSIVTAAATSSDLLYSGVNPSDISVTNDDNDTAGITVGTISGHTTEAGGTANFTIVLTSQPTASVSVGLSSSNTAEGTVAPVSVTFTTVDWATPQTVTVTGVDDHYDDGDVAYSIITATATSADGLYSVINPANVSVTNDDNDTAGITVSVITGNTTEAGGTATFTIVLDTIPSGDVGVGLSSSNTAEGTVAPSSVTFTAGNWNSAQTVTVTGIDDLVDDGNIAYTIITAAATSTDVLYSGLNPANVSVTNTDNDTAGVTVSSISGATTEAGGTATFTVQLNTQPTADVVTAISSSNTAEGTVAPTSLTFTSVNWASQQTVTVTGVNDDVDDGNIAYTIVLAAITSSDVVYSGLNPSDVSVTNNDDDTVGITVGTISRHSTEAGVTATATIVLNSQPTANVVIGLSSSNIAEGTVSPSSFTFTVGNWSTPQTVTATGVNDDVDDGNIAYFIVTAAATSSDVLYSGMNPDNISVTNDDNDTAGMILAELEGSTEVKEGDYTDSYTIVLATQPTASVSVTVASTTGEAEPSPAMLTFTTGNWATPQTVTVTAIDDHFIEQHDDDLFTNTVTSADPLYNAFALGSVTVVVVDNDHSSGVAIPSASSILRTLTVTAPPPGANVIEGSVMTVAWTYTGQIPAISVYLSTDAGTSWTLMRYNVNNNDSTTFTAPYVTTTQALVKVEGTDLASVLTTSYSNQFSLVTALATTPEVTPTPDETVVTSPEAIARIDAWPVTVSVNMLVKVASAPAVYSIGADGYRHAFPNERVYFTWYSDFNNVVNISAADLASITLGSNVTYKPGSRLVKFQTSPRVYAIDRHGVLRWVMTEEAATSLYGSSWNTKIDDISDASFGDYTFGANILGSADYDPNSFIDMVNPSDSL